MMLILFFMFFFSLMGVIVSPNLIYYSIFVLLVAALLVASDLGDGFYMDSIFFYDGVSLSLVLLSIWVSLLMIFSSYKVYRFNDFFSYFVFFVILLLFILVFTFFSGSFMFFYFFFEASLIPTLLIIMGWGYQPERLRAGVYFLFYTLTASLPLLILLAYAYMKLGGLSFVSQTFMGANQLGSGVFFVIGLMGSMAFLVKLPMYFTHLWLPKAHVEAPVAGSMILAGVLLKLGGYGLMRLFNLTGHYMKNISSYFVGLSLVGMIYIGLICCRVNDFKALVAYSSVAHMGMVICGVMSLFSWGYEGSLAMMVGHGLSSSGLFCIVNMYYERTSSRSFYVNSGLILGFPIFSMLMFMLSAANIAAPPTINLLAEIFLMASIMSYDYFMLLVFPLGSFLGAVFTLFMFSFTQHGAMFYNMYGFSLSNTREIHILFLHIIPINFMILSPVMLLSL